MRIGILFAAQCVSIAEARSRLLASAAPFTSLSRNVALQDGQTVRIEAGNFDSFWTTAGSARFEGGTHNSIYSNFGGTINFVNGSATSVGADTNGTATFQ